MIVVENDVNRNLESVVSVSPSPSLNESVSFPSKLSHHVCQAVEVTGQSWA